MLLIVCNCHGLIVSSIVVLYGIVCFQCDPQFCFSEYVLINVVSLPVYVKVTHLCVALSLCLSDVVVGCLWVGFFCVYEWGIHCLV